MADHGQAEYATATGNDLPAHEAMYDRFVHLVFVACCHVANIVIGLAIGALTGHWFVAVGIFIVATVLAFHGLRERGTAAQRNHGGALAHRARAHFRRLNVAAGRQHQETGECASP